VTSPATLRGPLGPLHVLPTRYSYVLRRYYRRLPQAETTRVIEPADNRTTLNGNGVYKGKQEDMRG
jgi:hypothetical protein